MLKRGRGKGQEPMAVFMWTAVQASWLLYKKAHEETATRRAASITAVPDKQAPLPMLLRTCSCCPAVASRTSASSQALTRVSSPPVTSTEPLSEKARHVTACRWAGCQASERSALLVQSSCKGIWQSTVHHRAGAQQQLPSASAARQALQPCSFLQPDPLPYLVVRRPRAQQAARRRLPHKHSARGAARRTVHAIPRGRHCRQLLRCEAALVWLVLVPRPEVQAAAATRLCRYQIVAAQEG